MKLPIAFCGLIFLAGCDSKKPAAASASAHQDTSGKLPYPESLKLISDAELASDNLASEVPLQNMRESLAELTLVNEATRLKSEMERDQGREKLKETRQRRDKAMEAVKAFKGSEFDQAQIQAFLKRAELKKEIAALEAQMNEATDANDTVTVKMVHPQIDTKRGELDKLNAEWWKISMGGWRDHVKGGGTTNP